MALVHDTIDDFLMAYCVLNPDLDFIELTEFLEKFSEEDRLKIFNIQGNFNLTSEEKSLLVNNSLDFIKNLLEYNAVKVSLFYLIESNKDKVIKILQAQDTVALRDIIIESVSSALNNSQDALTKQNIINKIITLFTAIEEKKQLKEKIDKEQAVNFNSSSTLEQEDGMSSNKEQSDSIDVVSSEPLSLPPFFLEDKIVQQTSWEVASEQNVVKNLNNKEDIDLTGKEDRNLTVSKKRAAGEIDEIKGTKVQRLNEKSSLETRNRENLSRNFFQPVNNDRPKSTKSTEYKPQSLSQSPTENRKPKDVEEAKKHTGVDNDNNFISFNDLINEFKNSGLR
ncbi:hypothetical protein ACNVED_05790 [Legionella sp. D16C41]|uniref:hypothetical protein n=1 Tax=Legionella sp. D16C41 TaxID=3402688 RepID=UPI003AF6D515